MSQNARNKFPLLSEMGNDVSNVLFTLTDLSLEPRSHLRLEWKSFKNT